MKKILRLPSFTPTYTLMLETGSENGHLYTLELHMKYVARTLFEYKEDRLPHKLTTKLLQRQIYWVKDLNMISSQFEIAWSDHNCNKWQWAVNRNNLLQALRLKYMENLHTRARQTNRIYKTLDTAAGQKYIVEGNSQEEITWIFKTRSDLIKLNGNRFQVNARNLCSLCNMNEAENIEHFLGRCRALKEFRLVYFKKVFLEENEIVDILNGLTVEWKCLANYVKTCIKYRSFLLAEFNY